MKPLPFANSNEMKKMSEMSQEEAHVYIKTMINIYDQRMREMSGLFAEQLTHVRATHETDLLETIRCELIALESTPDLDKKVCVEVSVISLYYMSFMRFFNYLGKAQIKAHNN